MENFDKWEKMLNSVGTTPKIWQVFEEMKSKINELEEVCHARYHINKGYERLIVEKDARIKELENALDFYANEDNYIQKYRSPFNSEYYDSEITLDKGNKAREINVK